MTTYIQDQELPALAFEWSDGSGNLIDFSTGWTFTATVCLIGTSAALVTKSSGITGSATAPNVTVDWSASDFSTLAPGKNYVVYLKARRTSDSKDRYFRPGNLPSFSLSATPA